jgi:hypothetical protein
VLTRFYRPIQILQYGGLASPARNRFHSNDAHGCTELLSFL